ncbi:hypothetical protein BSLG_005723 [Batrachochytrium salamandrivorans]|nr:hypothetical protein BSLG_005723 [Batrachochytrium salamandrivorans]
MVNKTQKTYPRDCAFAILKHVNRGNNTAAYLSLMNITATQHRILELMQLWNATLCVNSRYKEDFKHINDISSSCTKNLKTEDELEEEDRKAHGVKLEELIRKGTPAALAQANELMKVMTGYVWVDWMSVKSQTIKEVNQEIERIESRIILLNDMLNQRRPGESLAADSTIEELYRTAKSAQTKLQSFIELNDDEDRLARLLELNDLINIVLQKYSDVKSGKAIRHNDFDQSSAPNFASMSAEVPFQQSRSLEIRHFPPSKYDGAPMSAGGISTTQPAQLGYQGTFSSFQSKIQIFFPCLQIFNGPWISDGTEV